MWSNRVTSTVAAVSLAVLAGCAGTVRPAPAILDRPWAQGIPGEVESYLLTAEIVAIESLGSGVTGAKKLRLESDGRRESAVYKNVHSEYSRHLTGTRNLEDTYFSDKWEYEVAAYRLDRMLGFGLVPVTVARDVDGQAGSVQRWIPGATTEKERVERGTPLGDRDRWAEQTNQMLVFDVLIYNVDRNQGNILLTEPGSRMWLIDHSRAFRLRRGFPSHTRKNPPIVTESVRGALASLEERELHRAMAGLLTRRQVEAILARRDLLLASTP
jgi:hypothetical protein